MNAYQRRQATPTTAPGAVQDAVKPVSVVSESEVNSTIAYPVVDVKLREYAMPVTSPSSSLVAHDAVAHWYTRNQSDAISIFALENVIVSCVAPTGAISHLHLALFS
jgi:hypothetical protein